MTDRERLIEILSDNKLWCPSKKTQWGRVADAIIDAGFGDVSAYKDLLENAEKYAWGLKDELREKDKRIAELESKLEANGHDNYGNPIKYGVS